MKRLIALLLAMTLPLCAQAEAWNMSISLDADDQLFPAYIREVLAMQPDIIPADEADIFIPLMQRLLNDLEMTALIDSSALSVEVTSNGSTFLDLTMQAREQLICATSSLLPGYAISQPLNLPPAAAFEADNCLSIIQAAVSTWFASLEPTVNAGEFAGDAFDGGKVCRTWVVDDKDLSVLLNALVDAVLLDIPFANGANDGAAHVIDLTVFRAWNEQIAEKSKYTYILRSVEDEKGSLCGISLTILQNASQLATVSVGIQEKGIRFVLGLGLKDQNYWWELTAQKAQRKNLTLWSGASQEWMADKAEGFAYVKATNAPLSDYEWHCNITKSGKRYLWDGSVYENKEKVNYMYLFSSSGKYDAASKALDCSVSLGDSIYRPLTVGIKLAPTDAEVAPADSAVVLCNVFDAENQAVTEDLMKKLEAALMARMLKLLPLDLLLKLQKLNTPE